MLKTKDVLVAIELRNMNKLYVSRNILLIYMDYNDIIRIKVAK